MKKILHLTFHCAINYGAILQTYALGVVLKRLGHSVKILDLRPPWMSPIWLGKKPGAWIKKWHFFWFKKHYLLKMTSCHRNVSRLTEECENTDAVVVGSDQVWNPQITLNFSTDYFLKFVPSPVRRISYAASFGVDPSDWLKNYGTQEYTKLLESFYAISLREKSGAEICSKLLHSDRPVVVLDPTLLLSKEEYVKKFRLRKKNFGIVSYRFHTSDKYYELLKKIKFKLGGQVLLINNCKKFDFDSTRAVSPKRWLESIHGASLVVTDSFHATCFAIIFEKQFFVLPADEKKIGRIENLLDLLDLKDRLFYSEEKMLSSFESIESINYEKIEGMLVLLRKESINFLSNSLV